MSIRHFVNIVKEYPPEPDKGLGYFYTNTFLDLDAITWIEFYINEFGRKKVAIELNGKKEIMYYQNPDFYDLMLEKWNAYVASGVRVF